jgi:hypothetical protein
MNTQMSSLFCGELSNVDEPGSLAGAADVPAFIKLPEHFQLYLCWLKNTQTSTHFLKDFLMWMNLAVLLLLHTFQHELSNSFLLFRQVKNTWKSSQRMKDSLVEMILAVQLASPISELDYRKFSCGRWRTPEIQARAWRTA